MLNLLTPSQFAKTIHTNMQFYYNVYKTLFDLDLIKNGDRYLGFGANDGSFEWLLTRTIELSAINIVDVQHIQPMVGTYQSTIDSECETIDIATSLEALYLLSDEELHEHAAQMFNVLKSNGIYVFTNGFTVNNPLLSQRCDEAVEMYRDVPLVPHIREVDEYLKIFQNAGFKIGVMPMNVYYPIFGEELDNKLYNDLIDEIKNHQIFIAYK